VPISGIVCGTTDIVECEQCGAADLKQQLSRDAQDAFYQSDMLSNWFENDNCRTANPHQKQLAQYVSLPDIIEHVPDPAGLLDYLSTLMRVGESYSRREAKLR
jgi:hypothetical protein